MRTPVTQRILDAFRYLFLNFATPLVFYFVFHWKGAKPAIGFAIGVTLVQGGAHVVYRERFSPFFILSSGLILIFGALDLLVQDPRFFRFEPAVQNFGVGSLFWVAQWKKFPVIRVFVQALPRRIQSEFLEPDEAYLRRVTWVWVGYLYLKGLFFLYLAVSVDLGALILLKSVVGTGSLLVMMGGEWIFRRVLRRSRRGRDRLN